MDSGASVLTGSGAPEWASPMAQKVGFAVVGAGCTAVMYCYVLSTRLEESIKHIVKYMEKNDSRLDDMDKKTDKHMETIEASLDDLCKGLVDMKCHIIAMEGKQQLRNWQLGTCLAAGLVAAAAAASKK